MACMPERMAVGEQTWDDLKRFSTHELDEVQLRGVLVAAWPGDLESADFSRADGWTDFSQEGGYDSIGFTADEGRWESFASWKLHSAILRALGPGANFWNIGDLSDSYGYKMVEPVCFDMDKSIAEKIGALRRWHEIVRELEVEFNTLRERTVGLGQAEALELVAAALLRYIPSSRVPTPFKFGFEKWYEPFKQLLVWYSEATEMRISPIELDLIVDYDRGFRSYTYSVQADLAEVVGRELARCRELPFQALDSTQEWVGIRSALPARKFQTKSKLPWADIDGHLEFIDAMDTGELLRRRLTLPRLWAFLMGTCDPNSSVPTDLPDTAKALLLEFLHEAVAWERRHDFWYQHRTGVRGAERADRMRVALAACRADACAGKALTLPLLQEWHRLAVGEGAWMKEKSFRAADAYAKQGRERYPFRRDTQQRFEACLQEADGDTQAATGGTGPLCLRAARAYFDVLFFHPFDDGNSRVARLVLDFLLTREGLCLGGCAPLFTLPHRAGDGPGKDAWMQVLSRLVTKVGEDTGARLSAWMQTDAAISAAQPIEDPPRGPLRWYSCLVYDEEFYGNMHR